MTATHEPVAEGLITEVDGRPRLLGARCDGCRTTIFPVQRSCARCGGRAVRQIPLSCTGTLWTFTVQEFPLKAPYAGPSDPDEFEPFGVGYVELPDGIRVETVLTERDPENLVFGMPVELVLTPFRRSDGSELTTFAFRPRQ
ncbi:Uncharacterized OB-fold protein, contains Zn-ribbon domain [Haloechinothrix alba]|uniref:Uncharacterized OB-fold protein, contains Zn-ribbon domain n=1 Tax=Haloechinothrix alba TaxID=664784 RepID=A0A238Y4Q1_9PSEU|nr:OB-fold domain-containing protein [Haloechinothrix alba]SNR65643.1 Uncharacterized OB-fold protein, contains Zn-ribbon domain [Haloechinothrix alba]